MADEDPIVLPVEANIDEAQWGQQGDRAGEIFQQHAARKIAGGNISGVIKRELNLGSTGTGAFDRQIRGITETLKVGAAAIGDQAAQIRRTVGNLGDAFDGIGAQARSGFVGAETAAEAFQKDIDALGKHVEATKNQLTKIGADPNLFALVDREFAKVLSSARAFNDALQHDALTPELAANYKISFDNAQRTIFRGIAGIQSELRNQSTIQRIEGNRANQEADRQLKARNDDAQRAHGKEIVETQTTAARINTELKIAGAEQLQQQRAQSRLRIELVRQTFRQIQQIERGIAGIFRASGSILSGASSAIGASLSRIGSLFRRSNGEFNEGLRGALIQRESSISRSFHRQTESVRASTLEQSRVLQRFETQASTGVAGALSGRSSLGALFGGGLALGGGFAAFQGLREGIKIGGDFVQGLAVLQAQLKLTADQMKSVRAEAIELGNDITLPGVSALDAAQAIQILAKQFASLGSAALPNAQAAAKGVLELSRAAGVGAEEAARVVGAAVNVFGVEASKAVDVADQVTNALTNAAGVGFGEFADSFTQGAAVFKQFVGPSESATKALAEFNAGLAVLARSGITGSVAGAALKQFFLQASRGTDAAKSAVRDLVVNAGETGTLFFDAAGNARTLAKAVDILRRGTKGLSDAARTSTLQTLFGSRGFTAANALLNTTAAGFDTLTQSILTTGSAADIAKAQNTGLRGALDALKSVIETQQIKTYEKFQGALGKVVLQFANLLNLFFEGRGVLGIVRDGLTGIGIALGTLLAVKVVAEGFQFLAIALEATVTPLGALVVGAAALGAVVTILSKRVPGVRDAVDNLRDSLGRRLGDLLRSGRDLLGQFADLLVNRVTPAVVEFATIAERRIGAGLRTAFDFIQGTAIPTLRAFATTLANDIIPPLVNFAEVVASRVAVGAGRIVSGVKAAAGAISSFARDAVGLVQPAIDGFGKLSDSIHDLFNPGGGAFQQRGPQNTGLTTGIKAFLAGIAASFANIAAPIIAVVGPELGKVANFIGDFLASAAGSGKVESFLTGPFQRAVTAIGFFLGNLATDPRLVDAVTRLIGLAVLTGANFVKGIGKGIGDNLGGLAGLVATDFVTLLKVAFRKALNPVAIAKFLVSGLGALAISAALFRSLSRPMSEAGRKTGDGFVKSLGSTLRRGFSTTRNNPFAAGLFGGPGFIENEVARQGARAQKAVEKEFGRINRNLNRAGQLGVIKTGFVGNLITDEDIQKARAQFGKLQKAIDPRALSGSLLRAQFADIRGDVGNIFKGIASQWTGDIQEGGTKVRSSFGSLRRNIGDALNNIRTNIKETGIGIGQALGGAIVAGVGSALAGQQLGGASSTSGKAIGLAGIIASSLFAASAVGGGPQGVVVGGIVAAFGLVNAKLTASKKAADDAKVAIQGYVDVLKQVKTASEAVPDLASQITNTLLSQGTDVQRFLKQSQFSVTDFTASIVGGQANLHDAINGLTSGLGVDQRRIQAFINSEKDGKKALEDLDKAARGKTSTNQATALIADIKAGQGDAEAFVKVLQTLFTQGGDVQTAIGQSALSAQLLSSNVETVGTVARVTADHLEHIADVQSHINDGGLSPTFIDNYGRAAAIAAGHIDEIRGAIETLQQARSDRINRQIGDLTTKLDAAKAAADDALQAVLDLVSAPLDQTSTASLNALVQSIPNIAQGIADNLGLSGQDIFAKANFEDFQQQFATGIRDFVSKAVTENPLISPADLKARAQDIFTALNQVRVQTGTQDDNGNPIVRPLTSDEKQTLLDQANSLFDNPELAAQLNNVSLAQTSINKITDQIAAANAALSVNVIFNQDQIKAALKAAGLNANIVDSFFSSVPQAIGFAPETDAARAGGAGLQSAFLSNQSFTQALTDAQTAARDQAEAVGNLQTSADHLERAAKILADAVSQPPVVQVSIPPGPIPIVTAPASVKQQALRLAASGRVSGLIHP